MDKNVSETVELFYLTNAKKRAIIIKLSARETKTS